MKKQTLKISILPSLLAGDFGNLEASARKAETAGGDALHLDIMDGVFVPNISMGPEVVRMARRVVKIPLSVHLMIIRPDLYIERFREAGADTIQIHIEAKCDIRKTLRHIRKMGAHPGIVLNPETPYQSILRHIGEVDEILCMTVHPGFGGQKFINGVLAKIRALRRYCLPKRMNINIAVDGGIDLNNVAFVSSAGANFIIAGSSLYRAGDMAGDLRIMRKKAEEAFKGRSQESGVRSQESGVRSQESE
jgi:ribulose-phosphate 3-epimerase